MFYFPLVVGLFLVVYVIWVIFWLKNAQSEEPGAQAPVFGRQMPGRLADTQYYSQRVNKLSN
jgi:hypothetical protein